MNYDALAWNTHILVTHAQLQLVKHFVASDCDSVCLCDCMSVCMITQKRMTQRSLIGSQSAKTY